MVVLYFLWIKVPQGYAKKQPYKYWNNHTHYPFVIILSLLSFHIGDIDQARKCDAKSQKFFYHTMPLIPAIQSNQTLPTSYSSSFASYTWPSARGVL
jgi:hypothetical protein